MEEKNVYEDMERNNNINNIEIKQSTSKAYVRNILKLMKFIDCSSYDCLITKFNELTKHFEIIDGDKPLYSDNTIKNYCNCIIMVGTWDLCKDVPDKDKIIVNEYHMQIKDKINKKKLDNVKTDAQKENWITTKEFDELIKKMRKHQKSAGGIDNLQDFIIMLLYSGKWIKPLRNDYAGMFFTNEYNANQLYPNINYIKVDISKDLSHNDISHKFTIILNDDKVSKHYGSKSYNINKQSILSTYLTELYIARQEHDDTKKYLLVNPQDNLPMSKNNLTKNIQRITKTWLNKKVSTSAMRHMYISNLDHNKTSNKKLAEIAADMRHSLPTQQQNYKIVEPPQEKLSKSSIKHLLKEEPLENDDGSA